MLRGQRRLRWDAPPLLPPWPGHQPEDCGRRQGNPLPLPGTYAVIFIFFGSSNLIWNGTNLALFQCGFSDKMMRPQESLTQKSKSWIQELLIASKKCRNIRLLLFMELSRLHSTYRTTARTRRAARTGSTCAVTGSATTGGRTSHATTPIRWVAGRRARFVYAVVRQTGISVPGIGDYPRCSPGDNP